MDTFAKSLTGNSLPIATLVRAGLSAFFIFSTRFGLTFTAEECGALYGVAEAGLAVWVAKTTVSHANVDTIVEKRVAEARVSEARGTADAG